MDSRALSVQRTATDASISDPRMVVSARLVATSNVSTSSTATIDGVAVATKDVVLLTAQTSDADNGLWRVNTSGSWRRLSVSSGMLVSVRDGDAFNGTVWTLITPRPITLGTTDQDWVETSGAQLTATARFRVTSSGDSHSGLAARDGVTPVDGDIALDTNASTAANRGLWVAHSGSWTRAPNPIVSGMLVTVREGTARKDTVWILDTNGPITVGTTALSFVQLAPVSSSPRVVNLRGTGLGSTPSGLSAVDGVTPTAGYIIFNETDGKVWTAASGSWSLVSSTDTAILIAEGTVYAGLGRIKNPVSGAWGPATGAFG